MHACVRFTDWVGRHKYLNLNPIDLNKIDNCTLKFESHYHVTMFT